jgi:thiamine biosynthesis lipoprotein
MMRFASLIRYAGELSEGLVDATCLDAVEQSGYTRSLAAAAIPAEVAALAGSDGNKVVPAGRDPRERWKTVSTDPVRNEVTRPPGVRLDSGGIGKGLAADAAAETLADCESYSVSCAGDIRFGGGAGLEREIFVASPKQGEGPVARITSSEAAVATSGVTKRSWVDGSGRPAHHLIDPRTGRPVRSGVLQATAIAPTGVEAEIRAKAALLSGPGGGERWLVHGGAMVTSGGEVLTFGRCVEKVRSDP